MDAGGRKLASGWVRLCVKTGTGATVELGHTICATPGAACGSRLDVGRWHEGEDCDGEVRINGRNTGSAAEGWVHLCLDGG